MKNLSNYYLHLNGQFVYAVDPERDEIEGFIKDRWDRGVIVLDEPADHVTVTRRTAGQVVGYELMDPEFVSKALPAFLTPAEYNDAGEDKRDKYRQQRAAEVVEKVRVDLPTREWPGYTDAEMPDEYPGRWEPAAAIAAMFGFGAPYSHRIPGRLVGFHAAARELIAEHPHYYPIGVVDPLPRVNNGVAEAWFRIPHEDGLTEQVKDRRRKYKRPAYQQLTAKIHLGSDEVYGENLGEAYVEWHARLDQVAAEIPGIGLVCEHCRGLGFTS